MIETVVESIRVSLVTQARVVILKEVSGDRHLPIWIGAFEAEAIAMELQGITSSRPLPYDLLRSVIGELGGELRRIVVTDLTQDVFYARIIIDRAGIAVEIDSRPSDAIALAVRAKIPILVEDSVMDRAGVRLEDETEDGALADGEPGSEDLTGGGESPSAFRDFINSLNLDDFGSKSES
jgi:bifunctional DNase/RNase